MKQQVVFPSGIIDYYFGSSINELPEYDAPHAVFVTDSNIASLYPSFFEGRKTLVVPAGEHSKDISTIATLSSELLETEATRNSLLIGIGGGVVTDITGFLASVYMRGVRFGFVPTSLLAMVDAAIGGKNGVNLGLHKNIIGTIRQPEFILYDTDFLQTLPDAEWSNGFAEIIKYACIFDKAMFDELYANDISFYKNSPATLDSLITRCVAWKNRNVAEDEHEKSTRKLLNFGHTAGHAIENLYGLSHGSAVSIGMVAACLLSETMTGLDKSATERLKSLLQRYRLPVRVNMEVSKVMELLSTDKKRRGDTIDYILLTDIGNAIIHTLPLPAIEKALQNI